MTWTDTDVAERLEEAVATLKRLPAVRGPSLRTSAWPEIARSRAEIFAAQVGRTFVEPAGDVPFLGGEIDAAKAIDRMDEALAWIGPAGPLDTNGQALCWFKAEMPHKGWTKMARRLGRNRETCRRWWHAALAQIADRLNAI